MLRALLSTAESSVLAAADTDELSNPAAVDIVHHWPCQSQPLLSVGFVRVVFAMRQPRTVGQPKGRASSRLSLYQQPERRAFTIARSVWRQL